MWGLMLPLLVRRLVFLLAEQVRHELEDQELPLRAMVAPHL